MTSLRRLSLLSLVALLASCRDNQLAAEPNPPPPVPPVAAKTTLKPPPGPFNQSVEITFETDKPATIFYTVDGSDPLVEGKARISGKAPLKLTLTASTTVTWSSRTDEGATEETRSGKYLRAGGKIGSVSGVVVVGGVATNQDVALLLDNKPILLGKLAQPGELPFALEDVSAGPHRLVAMSDRDSDGRFLPILDFASQPVSFTLDPNDPFKASVEDVRLYLGASPAGLCTIEGTVKFDRAVGAQNLSVTALSPDAFGGGANPQNLLAQLGSGYRVFTNATDKAYRYVLTDLAPGKYVVVPFLNGFGNGGVAMNLQVNPLKSLTCNADDVIKSDHRFGPTALHGTVTLKPATAATGFVWGIVAARNATLSGGIQAVLMPAFFAPTGTGTELKGAYAGEALRDATTFDVRAFPSTDPAANPLTSALTWVINPFAPEKPHAQVYTIGDDKLADFAVP